MAFERFAFPKAEEEIQWHNETYGTEFAKQLDAWLNKVVECAPDKPKELVRVPLEKVLTEVPTKWGHVIKQLKNASALERVQAALAVIQSRKPPYSLHAFMKSFFTQDRYWVEIIVVVNVNRAESRVEIVKLH